MFNIGFFPQFKSADSVLLHGAAEDVAELSLQLQQFVASSQESFPIHSLAVVSRRHPAELFASRSGRASGSGYQWLCSPYEFETIQGKLEALTQGRPGHQYFELVQPTVRLVVSVGEYGAQWWQEHA